MFALAVVHQAAEVVSDLEALMALKVGQEMALMSFLGGKHVCNLRAPGLESFYWDKSKEIR